MSMIERFFKRSKIFEEMEKAHEKAKARIDVAKIEEAFETGKSAGYAAAKAEAPNPPRCTCDSWDEGRKLGFIRSNLNGFLLIGWRGGERLGKPEEGKVNESLFRWCPWCGCRARLHETPS